MSEGRFRHTERRDLWRLLTRMVAVGSLHGGIGAMRGSRRIARHSCGRHHSMVHDDDRNGGGMVRALVLSPWCGGLASPC